MFKSFPTFVRIAYVIIQNVKCYNKNVDTNFCIRLNNILGYVVCMLNCIVETEGLLKVTDGRVHCRRVYVVNDVK